MMIALTPEQQEWVQAHVDCGEYVSVEDAVRRLLDERIAERVLEEADDLAWAKPYVDEGLADVARGDVLTLEQHEARNDARLAAVKD